MNSGRSTRAGVRADIQGMRALAVGLVVLGHAGVAFLPGGYVGVDVFFVISGFLITGILVRAYRSEGGVSITGFYVRRARRILPAAVVAQVAIVLGSTLVYTSGRLQQVLDDTVWAAFFAVNIHYGNAGTGYFSTDDFVSPVQHFWSLAVEEQFYLVWPLAIAACGLLARGDRAFGKRLMIGFIAAVVLASLVWSVHRTDVAATSAYFSTLTRAYELGAGALLALTIARAERLPDRVKAALSWAGLAAVLVAATVFDSSTAFPGAAALLPVLGTVAMLAGGAGGPSYGAVTVLAPRPVQWLGDRSYSLYLWHWPCLILPAAYLGRDLRPVETVAVVGIALVAAELSYRFVETPFRRHSVPRVHPARALVLWPVGLALVLGTAGTVRAVEDWRTPDTGYVRPDVDPEPETKQTSTDPLVRDVGFAAELARAGEPLPPVLRPDLADLRDDITPLSGYDNEDPRCFSKKAQVTSRVCVTGDPDGTRTIVALGDSHMSMFLAPITRLATAAGVRVVPLLKERCLPFDFLEYEPTFGRGYTECQEHRAWVLGELARLKPDVIVVSGLYTVQVADPATGDPLPQEDGDRQFGSGAERALKQLRRLAPRVVVIGATPQLAEPSADCLASRRADLGACREPLRQRVTERDRLLEQATNAAGGEFHRMLPWFCDRKRTCPVVVRDVIVYRDATHITQTYAERLEPVFAAMLRL